MPSSPCSLSLTKMPEVTAPAPECAKHQWSLLRYDRLGYADGRMEETASFCCPECGAFRDVKRETQGDAK